VGAVQDIPITLDRVVVDIRVVVTVVDLPALLEDVHTRDIVLPSGSVCLSPSAGSVSVSHTLNPCSIVKRNPTVQAAVDHHPVAQVTLLSLDTVLEAVGLSEARSVPLEAESSHREPTLGSGSVQSVRVLITMEVLCSSVNRVVISSLHLWSEVGSRDPPEQTVVDLVDNASRTAARLLTADVNIARVSRD